MEELYRGYFFEMSELFLVLYKLAEASLSGKLAEISTLEGKKINRRLYLDVQEDYADSYANPAYAVSKMGWEYGPLLSALDARLHGIYTSCMEGNIRYLCIYAELFVEIYNCFEDAQNLNAVSYTHLDVYKRQELVRTKSNLVGLKEATGNLAQASKTMALTDGKLDLYSGEDGLVVPLMSIGAVGVISVWSNVAPGKVHAMCDSFFKGDIETARKLQLEALPLVDALFSEVNPIPVKKALNLMGMEVGPLRSPLCEMSEANAKELAEVMKNYGILA